MADESDKIIVPSPKDILKEFEETDDDWQAVLLTTPSPSLWTMCKNFFPAVAEGIKAGWQTYSTRLKKPAPPKAGEEWQEVEWQEDENFQETTVSVVGTEPGGEDDLPEEASLSEPEAAPKRRWPLSRKSVIAGAIVVMIIVPVSIGLYIGGMFEGFVFGYAKPQKTPQQELEAMQISYTPLNFVKYAGINDLKVTELFLQAGMDINSQRTVDGFTPLMAAVSYDRREMAEFLLKNGANINSKDNDGQTALMKAVKYNRPLMAEFLLENRADYNIADNSGQTALGMAKESYGANSLTEVFLKFNIDTSPGAKDPGEDKSKFAESLAPALPRPQQLPSPPKERAPKSAEEGGTISVQDFLKALSDSKN